ncbi:galactofuranosyltransferase [Limosilactobacillus frumenti DSM 13145]|uniref:Galactofuranosyltransferase n=1 Tax=Limosilactobacillus frumenti DSM 13145 TaxID=1423746 RepID=A0A0R1P0W0_9LACO|nr:sugar transferase [Limosilactobacillus frumenti]KRL26176.1 galactofuranosyltransferase [Limosilactobacillus frumenti DSM 13145]MBA2914619.1 sugar transferase [Limosilactobacillus frumenti]QFG72966.1 sugar transferase [Limosilactobacillus frumenti]
MSKVIFTVDEHNENNNAGPKAKVDFDYFMSKEGYQIVHQHFDVHSKFKKFLYGSFIIPNLFHHDYYDEMIFQYPTYSSYIMKRMIPKMREHSKKLYFLIHDVESLRLSVGNDEYLASERELFNLADGLIVHNSQMRHWLSVHGISVPMVDLDIFDYQNPQPVQSDGEYQYSICFAGNLAKSDFLNKLSLNKAKLDIYGPHPSSQYQHGVVYKGIYSPNELPKHLSENFGLVWDGSSVDTCDGKYGNYLRYNAPHKTSLYLSTGIPVIIWKKAALADFIVEHCVGMTVDSLEELDDVLTNITADDYKKMKLNAIKLARQIRSGYYSTQAVKAIEQY